MLDDMNVLKQRDPHGALEVAAHQFEQAAFNVPVLLPEHDGRAVSRVVIMGMGGSALSADLIKSWLKSDLPVPLEVVRSYTLPGYVNYNTLVIISSYSGNTEEALACFDDARNRFAQVATLSSGGKLKQRAESGDVSHVVVPGGIQPRMSMIYQLRGMTALLAHFGVIGFNFYDDIKETSEWLAQQTRQWTPDVTTDKNLAKQLALMAVGKTPVFYSGDAMAPVAYKWKISWNETAKNVAFCNQYPEVNHNEFIGWTSHPVEKPFAIFDLVSRFEHPRVLERFTLSDRLLSGKRPKSNIVDLKGDTPLAQMLYGCILADFASIYTAALNKVDPVPVDLIERLKQELEKANDVNNNVNNENSV